MEFKIVFKTNKEEDNDPLMNIRCHWLHFQLLLLSLKLHALKKYRIFLFEDFFYKLHFEFYNNKFFMKNKNYILTKASEANNLRIHWAVALNNFKAIKYL
jgi:hypothetical protein